MAAPLTFSDHLSPTELVKRWRNTISLGTLANWRSAGHGPRYIKVGGRILYRTDDIERWEAEQARNPKARQ